jgi:hypothetical protein
MNTPTYAAAVGLYEISRGPSQKFRDHLTDDLAKMVVEAGRVGARVLDDDLDYAAMEEAWAKGGGGQGFRGALRNILLAGLGLGGEG